MLDAIARKARVAAFAVVASIGAVSGAAAATIDFVIDRPNSSVTVTNLGFGDLCASTSCAITAALASGLKDGDTYTIGTGDTATFDFLTFGARGRGFTFYAVEAVLSFKSPAGVTGSGSGGGSAIVFLGSIISGRLTWSSAVLDGELPGGSEVGFSLSGFDVADLSLLEGRSITTTASLTGVDIVPLPAGGLLLISALGGLAVLRQRIRARAA